MPFVGGREVAAVPLRIHAAEYAEQNAPNLPPRDPYEDYQRELAKAKRKLDQEFPSQPIIALPILQAARDRLEDLRARFLATDRGGNIARDAEALTIALRVLGQTIGRQENQR